MPYTNNPCSTNGDTSETFIKDLYPELFIKNPTYDALETDDSLLAYYESAQDVGMTMDILATVAGRLEYVITLMDPDHAKPLKDYITVSGNLGSGYKATCNKTTVTISCGGTC